MCIWVEAGYRREGDDLLARVMENMSEHKFAKEVAYEINLLGLQVLLTIGQLESDQ